MPDIGPFVPALVVIGVAAWFGLRDRGKLDDPRNRTIAGWLLGFAVLGATLLAWDTSAPVTPIATERLQVADPPVHLDPGQRVALVVKGELPHVDQGTGASGSYTVEVKDADGQLTQLSGRVEEHWEQHRVGRRGHVQTLTMHNDARYALPSGPIDLSVSSKEGSIGGPLTLEVIPAPPPGWLVEGLAVALTLAAAILDAKDKVGTGFSLDVGAIGTFAALLALGMTPGAPVSQVVGSALASMVIGGGGAFLLRSIARRALARE